MTTWAQFQAEAGEFAALVRERFEAASCPAAPQVAARGAHRDTLPFMSVSGNKLSVIGAKASGPGGLV